MSFAEVGPGDTTESAAKQMKKNLLCFHSQLFISHGVLLFVPLLTRRVPYLQACLFPIH